MNQENTNKSTLVSKNITVLGKRTSIRLEPEMWRALHEIADREKCKIHDICSIVALRKNPNSSLTASIRVFVMLYYRAAATEEGHSRAQHGDFMNMIKRGRLGGQTPPNAGRACDQEVAEAEGHSLTAPSGSDKASDAMDQATAYMRVA